MISADKLVTFQTFSKDWFLRVAYLPKPLGFAHFFSKSSLFKPFFKLRHEFVAFFKFFCEPHIFRKIALFLFGQRELELSTHDRMGMQAVDSKWHDLAAMAWLWYVFVFFRRKVASLLVNWGTCLYVSDYVLYAMRCLSCQGRTFPC